MTNKNEWFYNWRSMICYLIIIALVAISISEATIILSKSDETRSEQTDSDVFSEIQYNYLYDYAHNKTWFDDKYAWYITENSFYLYTITRLFITNESYNLRIKYDYKNYYQEQYNQSHVIIVDEAWWND